MFVTTTVAWPVRRVAEVSRTPWRVVGLHYAEPVGESAVLEVVADDHVSRAAVAACVELGGRQGKTVLVVRDEPGGYTPRLTASLLVEGLHLLQEGVSADALEEALRDWGFPPIAWVCSSRMRPSVGQKWRPCSPSRSGHAFVRPN